MKRFRTEIDKKDPQWEIAVIFTKINQYFTGTMQDGILIHTS